MIAAIYSGHHNAQRIKVFIPYKAEQWRKSIKEMDSSYYHPTQKLWSVINTKQNLNLLKTIFKDKYEIKQTKKSIKQPYKQLNEKSLETLNAFQQKLILKAYSPHTVRSYRTSLIRFLTFFEERDLESLSKDEIEGFVAHLITKYKISRTSQNQLINAIKFYYEQVLSKPREYYNIQRPKKDKTLPNVLSHNEVSRLLRSTINIKHKAILYSLYGAGLRLSEVINLRIEDIHSDEGYLFIRGAKGKKDRRTVLPKKLLHLLRLYYRKEKPSYWLFEGINGGQYSPTSVQKIFRKAVKQSGINPWCTPHTLRHSFATHLLQNGQNFRMVQHLLGHESSKTTEIYTHIINVNNKTVQSPLDFSEFDEL